MLVRQWKVGRKPFIWTVSLIMLKILDVAKTRPGGIEYLGLKTIIVKYLPFQGFYPNWEAIFNLTLLRMLSFSLDVFDGQEEDKAVGNCLNCNECSIEYSCRKERCRRVYSASFSSFVGYIFYFPLYIAGPIITFNDWSFQVLQVKHNSFFSIPRATVLKAIGSFILPFTVFEVFNHFFYVRCAKESLSFAGFTFWQTVAYSYWSLKFLWLKFTVIWRFFRMVSLLEGVEAPENMTKCMSSHRSTMGFWRSWHASFNLWTIKYIYIPLGGRAHSKWNIWIVFAFVAIWHNFTVTLLAWGILVPLLMVPEQLLASRCHWSDNWRAIGASFNVLFMVVANMVGYALEWPQVKALAWNLLQEKVELMSNLCKLMFFLYCFIRASL